MPERALLANLADGNTFSGRKIPITGEKAQTGTWEWNMHALVAKDFTMEPGVEKKAEPGKSVHACISSLISEQGGLGGLVKKFESAGLGKVFQSWVGRGENLPVQPDQMQQALGESTVSKLCQKLGMNPTDMLHHLSQLFPQVVDKMTPQGKLPVETGKAGQTTEAAAATFKKVV